MNTNEAMTLSLQDMVNSNVANKFMSDWGVVTAVYGNPVATVDVVHYAPAYIEADGTPQPNKSFGVEVLYTATAGLSIEVPLAVGDTVLLVGSRNYVKTVADVTTANCPTVPPEPIAYTQETLKAIPMDVLNTSSTMYLRFKGGKMQLKNATKSLYTVLAELEDALLSFASASNVTSISGSGPTGALLGPMMTALNGAVTSAKTSLGAILEA